MGDRLAFGLWMIAAAMALSAILAAVAMTPATSAPMDAGVDGSRGGMLLVLPATRYAGECIAVDYEAVRGFVPGRPR